MFVLFVSWNPLHPNFLKKTTGFTETRTISMFLQMFLFYFTLFSGGISTFRYFFSPHVNWIYFWHFILYLFWIFSRKYFIDLHTKNWYVSSNIFILFYFVLWLNLISPHPSNLSEIWRIWLSFTWKI